MKNKVVFTTGSSRGISAATARLAVKHGAKVIIHGKNKSSDLEKLADELEVSYVIADVANKSDITKAVGTIVDQYGRIDALVNAAGIVRPKPFLSLEEHDFQEEFSVNVLGTIYAIQAVVPIMQAKSYGRIVNISSVRGITELASPRGVVYSMTKASIINLTAALAKELAPNITINAIAPGFTETDMAKSWNETVRKQANSSLLGRPADPNEIASSILFFASDASAFITGQTLLADGGYAVAGK